MSEKLQGKHTGVQYNTGPGEGRHPLDAFFKPRTVAVIGASEKEGSVGRTVLWNLIASPFGGTVYAVNPNRRNVLGLPAFPDIASVPETVDLAMVLIPAPDVPAVVQDCADAGVKGVIIISAGFQETGPPGRAREDELRRIVRTSGIRVIGPNSLGIMNATVGLNAAYGPRVAMKGSVGFISQSGAMCAAVLDWSFQNNVGFSAFVSFGSMIDVNWEDLIYYLGNDRNTKSIVVYMQSLGEVRPFLSAAREVTLHKPIIVLKPGQTEEGENAAQATAYYSGGDLGSDAMLSAAFRRSGVLRVDEVEQLFSLAEALGKQPRPRGPRLAIVSNAAGPGILATDALVNGGGELAPLAPESIAELDALLPPYWSHGNPVDIVADADPARYARAVEIVLNDPGADGVLVALAPQVRTDPTGTAEALTALKRPRNKPVLASFMGGEGVAEGVDLLNQHNIPVFPYPDAAAEVFNLMWQYTYNLRGLYETPATEAGPEAVLPGPGAAQHAMPDAMLRETVASGRTTLAPAEAKAVLEAYGITLMETRVAHDENEAIAHARDMGFPVVLRRRVASRPDRPDPGGVLLNLPDENAVSLAFRALRAFEESTHPGMDFAGVAVQPVVPRHGYEIQLGSHIDPQFGPALHFGAGGPWGQVFGERALGLPPLNSTLARRMMERTRIYQAMRTGCGGGAIDFDKLDLLLVRFGQLVVEQRRIASVSLNPLLVAPDRMVALDAEVVLHPADASLDALPPLAIRPYPSEYVSSRRVEDGRELTIRPIRPEDEKMMAHFHATLSKDTVYFRYFQQLTLDERVQHERLSEICFIDYDRAMALVAVESGGGRILGISRMVKLHGTGDADFAILISDAAQGVGLGTALMQQLIFVARAEGVQRLVGEIHPENRPMLKLCGGLGFSLSKPAGDVVTATMPLRDAG